MHTYIYVFMKTDLINIHIISIVDNFISENEKRLNWNPLFIHRHDSNNRPVSSFIQNIQIRRRRMFRSPKNIITIYCFFLGLFFFCHRYSHALNWVSIVCLFAVLAAFADICYIRSYTLYNYSTLYLFKVSFQMKKKKQPQQQPGNICIKMCSCDYRVHGDIKWNRCFWSIFAHFQRFCVQFHCCFFFN